MENIFSSSLQLDTVCEVSSEDYDIVKKIIAGDTDSFRILVERHMNSVMAIVSKRIPSVEARDVAHDVFVRAYNSLKKYKAQSPFQHWLAKIAVRECYDYWRKKYRHEGKKESLSEAELSIENFAHNESKCEALELVNYALLKLNPENRAVVILVHLEGYSVAEAADMLGWSIVNVKVRAHRAREQLREILKDLMHEK